MRQDGNRPWSSATRREKLMTVFGCVYASLLNFKLLLVRRGVGNYGIGRRQDLGAAQGTGRQDDPHLRESPNASRTRHRGRNS